jgi:glycerophosphoryl diester phosphodiesterase
MAVMVCAHRGLESAGPENSLEGVVAAVEAGFRAVEVDVRHTADGALVLMHDASVDRTSTGRGQLEELSHAEVSGLRLLWQGRAAARIPTLDQVLEACAERTLLYIDMKTDRLDLLVHALRKHRAHAWTILHGGPEKLLRVRELDSQLRLHTIVDSARELDRLLLQVRPIMVESSRLPEPDYLAYVHGQGLLLELDTMGEPDRQARKQQRYELWERYLRCGADFVMSDYPLDLRAFMEETLGVEARETLP